jgi:uncharacterized membrane protein YfcA
MEFGFDVLTLMFLVAVTAGCIDAIAGGGGLLVIPALLSLGLPPAAALATSKLQSSGGSLAASVFFLRKGLVDVRTITPAVIACFVGSLCGGCLLLSIDSSFLKAIIPGLLLVIAGYFLLAPNIGKLDSRPRVSMATFAGSAALPLGFYDGFFGPGTGSFLAIAFVLLLGFNLTKATAHAKLLNLTSNIAALIYFMAFGTIFWTVGLVMLTGQLIGGAIGARLVLRSGQRLIRAAIVLMSCAMSIKLLLA